MGKGPSNELTYDWVMEHCHVVLGATGTTAREAPFPWTCFIGSSWEERLAALRGLPREYRLTLSGRSIRLFHGRPVMEELVTLRDDTQRIEPFFQGEEGSRFDVVGYGDAHRQGLRTMTPGLFFNCGSVGNALGEARCCYALLEGDDEKSGPFEIRFRSLDYDRDQAVRDAKNTPGIPRIETYIREIQTGMYSR